MNTLKKAIFIDRDGTLVYEPEDEQVDSLEKLEFYPRVFNNLFKIKHFLGYELVMVTNQDGLGTESFPEEDFWPVQNKITQAFENEGIYFDDILIDRHFPHENSDTRKPGTGMMTAYMNGTYDLENSYVIGDRVTDIQLAKNMGCKGIFISGKSGKEEVKKADLENSCSLITESFDAIYEFLATLPRTGKVSRKTKETQIEVQVQLDGSGKTKISTGLGFFDHMLDQIGKHSGINLEIETKGDLHVDEHHTMEDTALALGEAFVQALGNKRGIERYGYCLPMDESLAQVALDFGGRPWIVWEVEFKRDYIGDTPTEMYFHFFKSFSDAAKCNLNIKAEGDNDHHKIEAIFKAFARSIKQAIKKDPEGSLPSTKGLL